VTVRESVATALARFGVRDAFGLVGSGNLELANALVTNGVSYHGLNHEASVVAAATGYARVSGSVGVATVHQGPGFTNTLTALTEAVRARTPLLLLAAESVAGNQSLDQVAVTESLGAVGMRLEDPADVTSAFARARDERRAVVLNLPLDVQRAQAPQEAPPLPPEPPALPGPSTDDLARLHEAVSGAERPVILAGRGALHAGEPLARLADSWGAMLATTAAAHGLFAGHPRALGISGGFALPYARRFLGATDVVLVFGASLNRWTTDGGQLFREARLVQVDLERPAEGVPLWVQADALATAEALELHGRGWNGALPSPDRAAFRDESTPERIDPRTLMVELDELLPADRGIVLDGGQFEGWPALYLTVRSPDQFVPSQAFQSIGLGLGTAIGACLAWRDRLTVAVIGDGGGRMSLTELEVAVRLKLPLLIVVMNDASYNAEVHDFGPLGVDVGLARLPDLDFAAVAQSLGAPGATVRAAGDLQGFTNPDGPLLLDCKINPDVRGSW